MSTNLTITAAVIIVAVIVYTCFRCGKKIIFFTDNLLNKFLPKIFPKPHSRPHSDYDPLVDDLLEKREAEQSSYRNHRVDDRLIDFDYVDNTYYQDPVYFPHKTVPDYRRDPRRTFSKKDISEALYRAQYRCEHVDEYGNRCCETDNLQADHHFPHSKGGATRYNPYQDLHIFENNLVMLCQKHNREKYNHHPSKQETMRINQMRKECHYV